MTGVPTEAQLRGFVDDLERSLDFDIGLEFDCDDIILCGVGGSAVSGDFAADCCYGESVKRIRLMKYPDLPSWVGGRTLAVVSSYSGNTAETMEMYSQARDRGCIIVAITSGGLLKGAAESNGDHLVLLPEGMHPRHAIGYKIGYTLAVIRAAGGPDLGDRICAFIPDLRRYRDEAALADGSLAHRLAERIEGHVPVVFADASMQSVAFRWKTQVNENSKFVAFCDQSPSFINESLRPWEIGGRDDFILIMLMGCDDDLCAGTSAMEDAARRLSDSHVNVEVIRLGGRSTLENMFRGIILGDYVSVYMAERRGIDPAEVRPVMQMKRKLASLRDQ